MAYDNKCGSCSNFYEVKTDELYDKTNASYVKGFCTWYGVCYYPDDSCREHYSPRESSSNGCYLTTIICNRLGLADDCMELKTLRSFRDSVLQKDDLYKDLLFEYDSVGPMIAKELMHEDYLIIKRLFNVFIQPIVSLIKERKDIDVIDKYSEMTNILKSFYGIDSKEIDDDYDYRVGGHGKVEKIKKNFKNKEGYY